MSGETREKHHRSKKEEGKMWLVMLNVKRVLVLKLETSPLICQFVVTGDLWQVQFQNHWGGGGAEIR